MDLCAGVNSCTYIMGFLKGNSPVEAEHVALIKSKCEKNPYPFRLLPVEYEYAKHNFSVRDPTLTRYGCHRGVVNDALQLIRNGSVAFIGTELALIDIMKCQTGVEAICFSRGYYIFLNHSSEGRNVIGE